MFWSLICPNVYFLIFVSKFTNFSLLFCFIYVIASLFYDIAVSYYVTYSEYMEGI